MNEAAMRTLLDKGSQIGLQIIGAILLWIVGRWLINGVVALVRSQMEQRKMDPTLVTYAISTTVGLLNVILVISILGTFGVQTTTFAAMFAAIGLAIGTAWSGLLANFAAGVFMILLRPFKVGDKIQAGGTSGVVEEIGPFSTVIVTDDNVRTIVGNNKILGDNILNYSANPHRRVILSYQLFSDTDIEGMMAAFQAQIATVPNILPTPAPSVGISEYTAVGPKLSIEVSCSDENFDQVKGDLAKAIRAVEKATGYSAPVPVQKVITQTT